MSDSIILLHTDPGDSTSLLFLPEKTVFLKPSDESPTEVHFLATHAHNYQRYTRTVHFGDQDFDVPFIVCGV